MDSVTKRIDRWPQQEKSMASRTKDLELGNEVLKRERALAAEKLKDMKHVFVQLAKMMDSATLLHKDLDGFTKKYGMNKQAIEELFGLSAPQLALIRSATPIAEKSPETSETPQTEQSENDSYAQETDSPAPSQVA